MGIEHRKQKRVILRKYVVINGTLRVMGLDLSEGGLYVHTGRSFKPGTRVDVSIPLSETPVNLTASVKHSEDCIGMGLMFLETSPDALAEIRQYMDCHAENHADIAKKKVLIVNDNALSRRMTKSRLILDGFTVLEANDSFQAITVLEKGQASLVVLDLYMERMDGFKFLTLMRQHTDWKEIPVLVLSARNTPDEIEQVINAGATEFLPKVTTEPAKLSERIQQYLSSKS